MSGRPEPEQWLLRGRVGARGPAARERRVPYPDEFSGWMMEMLHADPSSQPGGAYTQRLKEARLGHLRTMHSFAVNFAENYVGIDSPDATRPKHHDDVVS
jgi:hypothetical protein